MFFVRNNEPVPIYFTYKNDCVVKLFTLAFIMQFFDFI